MAVTQSLAHSFLVVVVRQSRTTTTRKNRLGRRGLPKPHRKRPGVKCQEALCEYLIDNRDIALAAQTDRACLSARRTDVLRAVAYRTWRCPSIGWLHRWRCPG